MPHRQHVFDLGAAVDRAKANMPVARAVRDFNLHAKVARHVSEQFTRFTGLRGFGSDEALAAVALGLQEDNLRTTDRTVGRLEWLIDEGQRLNRLERRQHAIRTGSDRET